MDNSVEVRYAGVIVGRGVWKELGADALFVGIPEPLPVGTLVTLKMGDASREARVDEVVESAEPTAVGMRVRLGGAAPAARFAPPPSSPPSSSPSSPPSSPPSAAPSAAPAPVAAAPVAPVAAAPVAPAPERPVDSGPMAAAPASDSGPTVAAEAGDAGSGALPAPLSLAGAGGDAQHGGGKKRRKRR